MSIEDLLRTLLFLPNAATEFAENVDRLHFFVISTTLMGSVVTMVAVLWFGVRYRRRDLPATTPHIAVSRKVELGVVGSLLGLFVLWWVLGFLQYIGYATPPAGAREVYLTAKQWIWKFAYPDGRATAGVLVVPVDRRIRLVMTSRDVIHSFYVPAFRLKQDVLPGRYTSTWFEAEHEGIFDVYCAEYCGTSHSMMRAAVVALSPRDYQDWLDGEQPAAIALAGAHAQIEGFATTLTKTAERSMADQGREAAAKHGCFACHTIDGQPHIGPTWLGLYGKRVQLTAGENLIADEEYLTRSMMQPMDHLVRGYRPVMPTYLGTLSQSDAAAIVEFIRSLEPGSVSVPPVALPETHTVAPDAGSAARRPVTEHAGLPQPAIEEGAQ